jgi:hypothetical protein
MSRKKRFVTPAQAGVQNHRINDIKGILDTGAGMTLQVCPEPFSTSYQPAHRCFSRPPTSQENHKISFKNRYL